MTDLYVDLFVFASAGLILSWGRLWWLVLLSPIAYWTLWPHVHYLGPDDDVTGLASFFYTAVGFLGAAAGVAAHRLGRHLLTRIRASN